MSPHASFRVPRPSSPGATAPSRPERGQYRGVKDDDALRTEVALRLVGRRVTVETVLAALAEVAAEWHAQGWAADPLEPIGGALGTFPIAVVI